MADGLALALALLVLAVTLAVAVVRPPYVSEALAAAGGAVLLVIVGAIGLSGAGDALRALGPTVGFLAAMLLIADGCRREGLFDAMGAVMARGSGGNPRRLLAFVFVIAAAITAVLSLDATIVLLTPVVFATAARMRTSAQPAGLRVRASGQLGVAAAAGLQSHQPAGVPRQQPVVPAVRGADGAADDRGRRRGVGGVHTLLRARPHTPAPWGRQAGAAGPAALRGRGARVHAGRLRGELGGGDRAGLVRGRRRDAMSIPALARRTATPLTLTRAVEPGFLIFVLGLGVIVQAASANGLDSAVRAVLPTGGSLSDLLAIAALSAIFANLVNNLPATLMLVPVAAAAGPGPVLATLIGVNVGPNLTYVGSLATLLWRRVLRAEDADVELGEFLRLGALTVPAALVAATVLLWLALKV